MGLTGREYGTLGNMNGVASESGSFPNQTPFFGEQGWDFATDELVADRLVTVRVDLIRIRHFPCSA